MPAESSSSRRLVTWLVRSAWLAVAVLAAVLPPLVAWGWAPPSVPEQVKALWVEGKITIVEMMDFDCASCRSAEPQLQLFRQKMGEKIHFVRLATPMSGRGHEHARDAARAYLAARAQGKGEEMAEALFGVSTRSPEVCRELARSSLHLNMAEYDRVVSAPATEAEIDATISWATTTGRGLPMIWIGDQLITGVPNQESLLIAYRKALLSASAQRH